MPKLWKCTACGVVSFWDDATFNCYDSLLLAEEAPQWRIVTCSADCLEKAKINLSTGKWTAARVKRRGWQITIIPGKNYEPQPSKKQLLTEYNLQQVLKFQALTAARPEPP